MALVATMLFAPWDYRWGHPNRDLRPECRFERVLQPIYWTYSSGYGFYELDSSAIVVELAAIFAAAWILMRLCRDPGTPP